MIQIFKRAPIPSKFLEKAEAATAAILELASKGVTKFEFHQTIYGSKEVKEAMLKDQNNKCCYCEVFLTRHYGDVEHQRPKGGVQQEIEDPIAIPGYYWLAYKWENLFLTCAVCNRAYKRNFFPLANPNGRALSPEDPLENEEPLIVNPLEDPSEHLEFKNEVIKPKSNSIRGEITIKGLGLWDEGLEGQRRKHLCPIARIAQCIELYNAGKLKLEGMDGGAYLESLKDEIRRAMQPDAEFSAMIRDNFAHLLR